MKPLLLSALIGLSVSGLSHAQSPAVNVSFLNQTAGERDSSDIWINFSDGGAPVIDANTGVVTYDANGIIGTAIVNGVSTNITTNSSFQLSTVENGSFLITGFGGGRGYVSYGAALTNPANTPQIGPYAGWQPAPSVPDPNFTTRFQAFELTIQPITAGSAGSYTFSSTNQAYADLSYIDQISISTGIRVANAPAGATNTTQTSENTKTLVDAVKVYQPDAASPTTFTAGTNIITKADTGAGQTQYYQVAGTNPSISYQNPGSTSVANPAPAENLSNFVRVAGPGQMPSVSEGGATTLYHTWDNYIAAVSPGGSLYTAGITTTSLEGLYGPAGVTAQTYTGNATFHTGTILLGSTEYTGYVLINNLVYNGGAESNIVIPFSALTASTGLYGTNPAYAVEIGTSGTYGNLVAVPGNDLQTRVTGDVVAGMNFGLLGSTVEQTVFVDGLGNPIMIGNLTSDQWWSLGTTNPEYLYAGAQANPDFYNTYSAALAPLTTAYTFGIQDRLGQNTTQFNLAGSTGNTVLEFWIQPDLAPVPVPEPTSAALIGIAGIGLTLLARRRTRKDF